MDQGHQVPVSFDRHAGRYWKRFSSYEFARHRRIVPIVIAEYRQVAATLPIVFVRADSEFSPAALLRLSGEGETALISPKGLWLGSYVPSILRVYPFDARAVGDECMELLVDEASGLISDDPADEPFFDETGSLAPNLAEVVEFFRKRGRAEQATRGAVSDLVEHDLLRPLILPEGADPSAANGLYMVSHDRLAGLEPAAAGALHHSGALALAEAQLISCSQLPLVLHLERRAAQSELGKTPQMADHTSQNRAEEQRISGFLDALAESQRKDKES